LINNGTGAGNFSMRYNDSYAGGLCYQETATSATSCGGLSTGNYFVDTVNANNAYFYMNYTKPANSLNTSKWQVKYGVSSVTANFTLPSTCWAQAPLQFRILLSGNSAPNGNLYGYCWTGSTWQQLWTTGTLSSGYGTGASSIELYDGIWTDGICYYNFNFYKNCGNVKGIYEEAIWWNLSSAVGVITTECANNSAYSSSIIIDNTWKSIKNNVQPSELVRV
jgi:hypothetical protein